MNTTTKLYKRIMGRASPEIRAQVYLHAAAPDLLAVARRLARYCEQNSVPELQGIACDAFNAIAKAEGRKP